jgi:hypothetical protein
MFKAILIERDERPYRAGFTDLDEGRLPAGDVSHRPCRGASRGPNPGSRCCGCRPLARTANERDPSQHQQRQEDRFRRNQSNCSGADGHHFTQAGLHA